MQPETSLGDPGSSGPSLAAGLREGFVTIEQVSVQTQIALSYFCLLRK